MVRQGKRAIHKCPRVEGGISGPEKLQGPVPKSNSVGCYRQLNSSGLLKQTRRNPLSGHVCSPVENHDLVPSLPDNSKSQAHSRVPESDGRPTVRLNLCLALTVTCYFLAFTGIVPKFQESSKGNLSVVLNELTKAPFEPIKDTDPKHLTLKTAFLLALAYDKRRSEIHAWVADKVSNLGQWEKVHLFPS